MKFLVDAQLPPILAIWLSEKGFDAIHTDNLPDRDETPDSVIRSVADAAGRIVITKDSDFYDSHLLFRQPAKLVLITTQCRLVNPIISDLAPSGDAQC